MRDYLDIFLTLILILVHFWALTNVACMFASLGSSIGTKSSSCKPKYRVEYVLPGITLGCWLGEEVE